MKNDMQRLIALLPPPAAPTLVDVDWNAVESELQVVLPDDYKQFISIYGLVDIGNTLYVMHPKQTGSSFREQMIQLLSDTIRQGEPVPHPLYPASRGLLPVIQTDNDQLVCWITDEGNPNEWRTFFWADLGQTVHECDLSFSEFMSNIFARDSDLFCREFPESWYGVDSPYRIARPAKPPESI